MEEFPWRLCQCVTPAWHLLGAITARARWDDHSARPPSSSPVCQFSFLQSRGYDKRAVLGLSRYHTALDREPKQVPHVCLGGLWSLPACPPSKASWVLFQWCLVIVEISSPSIQSSRLVHVMLRYTSACLACDCVLLLIDVSSERGERGKEGDDVGGR